MTDLLELINTGSWDSHAWWVGLACWLVLTAVIWALLRFFRSNRWNKQHSHFYTALLAAIPAIIVVLSGMAFLGGGNSSAAVEQESSTRSFTSPVMLVADTADTPSFKCINTEQRQYSDSTRPKVIVEFDLQNMSGPASHRIIKGIDETIDEQALRCFRQVRFARIGADQQPGAINYAIPVEFKQLEQEFAGFDSSETAPVFMETENLPGKKLALRINTHDEPGMISGKLLHGDPKKPLPNADIVLKGTQTWTATDEEGEFHLYNLPSGMQQFNVNYLGHTIGRMQIRIN